MEKYPENFRHFCLALHYFSPRAYKFVRQTFNDNLPHPKTIQAWLANSDVCGEPGLHQHHLDKLKKIAAKFNGSGSPLVCSLVFDEMYIRKQMVWSFEQNNYVGLARMENFDDQPDKADLQNVMANQVILFMLKAVNANFNFPVAYYLIDSLTKIQKKDLLSKVISGVLETGIKISNITSDGLASNFSTFSSLGANLDIFSSQFKTHFCNDKGEKIHIILDPAHMIKLVRNTLAGKGCIYDDKNKKIEWRYFEALYQFSKDNDLRTHKLNKKHIQWEKNKMNTRIAIETMSGSCANSMEFLNNVGIPEFENADASVRFIRIINNLFDIFNSKNSNSENVYKNELSSQNKRIIFDFFRSTIQYFKSLKIEETRSHKNKVTNVIQEKKVMLPILKSRNFCAFKGLIIDMYSMISMYTEYVERSQMIKAIPAYNLLQDVHAVDSITIPTPTNSKEHTASY